MSKTEVLKVRVTPDQRQSLEQIVTQSGLGDLSDHIRKAIDEYAARHTGEVPPDSRAATPGLSAEDEDDND